MKKTWLLIAVIAVISCKKEAPVEYTILSGNITNKEAGDLTLGSYMDSKFKESITVDEDGSFVDTLTVNEGTYILYEGKNFIPVYLSTGSDIKISYDAKDFANSLNISGVGAETSNYLREKRDKEIEFFGKGPGIYELEEGAYKAKFLEVETTLGELVASYEGVSEAFKTQEKKILHYSYLKKLSIYEKYHAHYAKKPDFKISEDFLNELDGLDYENEEDFKNFYDYKSLVRFHNSSIAAELAKSENIEEDIAFLKTVGLISNETIKNTLLFEEAKSGITYSEDIEGFYNTFMAVSTNEENKKEITDSYNKLKKVAKGQPSPKFVGYENNAGGTTSLDDLKGKFVYVDVWATWCGPCKREIPFLKEVEKKYHGKNIEFVSLSVDKADDHDKWKAMIVEKELGGIQLFADKSWKSDFVEGYLIKGIPRFILIDPDGNIVSSSAPRPSSEKLIEMFDENNI